MSRKSGVLDDMFVIATKLPWWASVGIAIVLFLALHAVAAQPLNPPGGTGQIADFAARTLYVTFASYGKWILPIPFLFGAAVSAFQRGKREALHAQVSAASQTAGALEGMSWQQFEQLVGESFRRRGFAVVETGGGGADGGVDLVLKKDSERYLVQCKQWRAMQVGVPVVRELYGVMAARGATGGFVVTSGKFSPAAIAFAEGRNIELLDGQALALMIRGAKAPPSVPRVAPDSAPKAATTESIANVPTCPRCGAQMLKRVAKQGSNAGKPFWGCSTFPACRGIRAVE